MTVRSANMRVFERSETGRSLMSIHYNGLRTVLQEAANPFGGFGIDSNGFEFG